MLSAHIICFSEEGSCILIGVKLKLNVLMAPLFHASLSIFRASNHRRWFPCIDWPQGKLVKLQAQCGQILFEIEVKTGDFNSGQKLKIQNFAINNDFFLGSGTFEKSGTLLFAKKQGHCYSKRGETRLPNLFLNINDLGVLHPVFWYKIFAGVMPLNYMVLWEARQILF